MPTVAMDVKPVQRILSQTQIKALATHVGMVSFPKLVQQHVPSVVQENSEDQELHVRPVQTDISETLIVVMGVRSVQRILFQARIKARVTPVEQVNMPHLGKQHVPNVEMARRGEME